MTSAKFAAPGSLGALADKIGWFDFGAGFTLVSGAPATHVINTLPDGFSVEFDISSVNSGGVGTNFVATVPPTYVTAAFGQTGYTGIGAPVALYLNTPSTGTTTETIHISNIVVKNSKGVATTTFRWVTADAEQTGGEGWSTTTDGSVWALLDNLTPTNGAPATNPIIVGVGTATVSEIGNLTPPIHTSAPIFISNSPSNIIATTTTPAREAFAFGIVITAREQAVTDLIESVALEQAGLSHILNAEGEKIQRVVNGGGTIAEAMAVNCSVQEMVKEITRLEFVLQSKLNLVLCDISACDGNVVCNTATP